jgi:hypothetical protein
VTRERRSLGSAQQEVARLGIITAEACMFTSTVVGRVVTVDRMLAYGHSQQMTTQCETLQRR